MMKEDKIREPIGSVGLVCNGLADVLAGRDPLAQTNSVVVETTRQSAKRSAGSGRRVAGLVLDGHQAPASRTSARIQSPDAVTIGSDGLIASRHPIPQS
jgi:hypothetical protein